jgi:hypothetical protein
MKRMDLPDQFAWRRVLASDEFENALKIGGPSGVEVALASQRANGAGWLSEINRHKDYTARKHAVASSRGQALCWMVRWTHQDILRQRARDKGVEAPAWLRGATPSGRS